MNVDDDALIGAARALAGARAMSTELFDHSTDALRALGSGDGDPTVALLKAVNDIHVEMTFIIEALSHLIGDDIVAQETDHALQQINDMPPFADHIDTIIAASRQARWEALNATTALIRLPDGDRHWGCPDPLLGAAIAEALTRHLTDHDVFIADVAETPNGTIGTHKVVIPAGTTIEWTHSSAAPVVSTAVAAQVEDHINRFGGVTLNTQGQLIEATDHRPDNS